MPNQVLTIEPQNELKFKGKCAIVIPLISYKPLHCDLGSIHRSTRELAADKWSFYFQISAFDQGAVFSDFPYSIA